MTNEPEPPKPKNRLPLIAGTALTTVAIASAAFFGISRISQSDSNTAAPTQTTNQPQTQPTEIDLKIKGNRKSKIYHLKGCPNYDDISARNIVWFKTHEEAKAAGYRIAKNC